VEMWRRKTIAWIQRV